MINLSSVNKVFLVTSATSEWRSLNYLYGHLFSNTPKAACPKFKFINLGDGTTKGDNNSQLMEELGPVCKEIDKAYSKALKEELNNWDKADEVAAEHKVDPKVLFLIDTSNKAGSALVRLAQGPWGGNPAFAKHTLAIDLSE